jgi:hypothetical protein
MQAMSLLHIPKTGGVALSRALGRHVFSMGHTSRLEDLPIWPPIITIVRDPAARFVSAWDMVYRQKSGIPEFERWPTPSEAALVPEARAWLEDYWGRAFLPQVHWLRDASYALGRCWYIAHTETLTRDFETIRDALGLVGCEMPMTVARRNANPGEKSTLTDAAAAAIREHYADDIRLLEAL